MRSHAKLIIRGWKSISHCVCMRLKHVVVSIFTVFFFCFSLTLIISYPYPICHFVPQQSTRARLLMTGSDIVVGFPPFSIKHDIGRVCVCIVVCLRLKAFQVTQLWPIEAASRKREPAHFALLWCSCTVLQLLSPVCPVRVSVIGLAGLGGKMVPHTTSPRIGTCNDRPRAAIRQNSGSAPCLPPVVRGGQ